MYIMYKYITYGIVVILVSQLKLKKWEILSWQQAEKIYIENAVFVYGCSFGELQWPDVTLLMMGVGGGVRAVRIVSHTLLQTDAQSDCGVVLWPWGSASNMCARGRDRGVKSPHPPLPHALFPLAGSSCARELFI